MRTRMTTTGRLLWLLALYLDVHACVVSVPKTLRSLSGDPRCRRHRQMIEEYLRNRQKLNQTAHDLKRRGYLQAKVFGNTRGFILTSKGEEKLFYAKLHDPTSRTKLAGGQWLMAFFDIPERLKREREILRTNLRLLEFEPLQKSIWVTRNDVRAELRAFLNKRQLMDYVKLLLVKELGKEGKEQSANLCYR